MTEDQLREKCEALAPAGDAAAAATLRLLAEVDRLRELIWPGLATWPWVPTADAPQQDFYEAAAEALHARRKAAERTQP